MFEKVIVACAKEQNTFGKSTVIDGLFWLGVFKLQVVACKDGSHE